MRHLFDESWRVSAFQPCCYENNKVTSFYENICMGNTDVTCATNTLDTCFFFCRFIGRKAGLVSHLKF
jgi:hypothetical protein